MPIECLAACLVILAVLQGLSILLANLQIAAKQIEGRSTWVASDGTVFEEFSVSELETSRIMQREFSESRSEFPFAAPVALHANR